MRLKNHSLRLSLLLALLLGVVGFSFPLTGILITPMALAQSIQTKTPTFYSRLPLNFERNQGQLAAQVKFIARGSGYNLFLTSTEAVLALQKSAASKSGDKARFAPGATVAENRLTSERSAVRMKLVGANPNPHITGLDKAPANVNYFIGNDPAKWRTNLPTYNKVRYERVYPGVDLVYYGNQQQLEYDFVVAPGADPTRILLGFAGVDRLVLNPEGDLVLQITNEQIRMHKPLLYQEMAGVRQEIAGGFVLRGENQVAFQIGQYDTARTLIIDPVIEFAGYIGNTGQDVGLGISVDNNGYVYVVGSTDAVPASFPVVGGPDLTFNGGQDAFVTKLTPDGTQLVYSGLIGGAGQDFGMNIAVDNAGNAYVTGYTNSDESSFPVMIGPDLSYNGGQDTFVAKVSADGSHLLYSGYIGGSGWDAASAITVDDNGNAYIGGSTNSNEATFPVSIGPDLTFNGVGDVFVAKVKVDGTGLDYAGYIGGNGDEAATGITVAKDCVTACPVYISGSTWSAQNTFPVIAGPDLTYNGGTDAFVARVKADGTGLDYAGYVGGSGADYFYSIAVDREGNAYVYGNTDSTEATLPVMIGPSLTYKGGRYDAFIAKLNVTGTALLYSGYIGGAGDEFGRGIALDDAGNAYVSGWTSSTEATFPVNDGPDLTYNGGPSDVFIARVNAAGTALDYAGYIGGSGEDATGHANPIAVDTQGNASYIIGATNSNEATFPVTVGPDLTFNGAYDSFVAKIVNTPLPPTPTAIPPLHITTESPLPSGKVGQAYSAQLTAGGGTPPYTWAVVADALPSGLMLNETTGAISGVATIADSFRFTMQVTDHAGSVATKQFALTIETLFTDLGVSGTEIHFEPTIAAPGQPVTIKAKVQNLGLNDAADIRVDFVDFGTVSQQTIIPILPAGTVTEVTFATTYASAGLRLIAIRVDPDNLIDERNEDNNEASKVLQVGQPDVSQATMVIQASSVATCQGQTGAISGQAYYDFSQAPGTNDYPVQGGRVIVTLLEPITNNPIAVFSGAHTNVNGHFSQTVIAPAHDGPYPVRVTVTDQTLTQEIQTTLTVSGSCPVPLPVPPPTLPPPGTTPTPPPNGPPVRDAYVRSEDIYFSNDHPNPGETIQLFAYIHYYGSEPVQAIPVTLYDVLPVNGALAKLAIGATQVSFQSGANSPVIVSVPWTGNPAGAHVIQVVVEPPFDQFTQNDKATRLILVGDVSPLEIQKSLALLLDADGDGKVSPGDRLQYTINYRNTSTGEATNAIIIDDYDEGLLAPPTPISQGGAIGNGVITWQLGTLAPGASGAVTYQADILSATQFPPGRTKISNIALLIADEAPAVAASAEVEITVNRPPLIGVELSQVTRDEGEIATNRGAVSDPDGDMVTLSASIGAVTNNGDGTWSWSFHTSDGPPQSQLVTIQANDGHGGASQTSFNLIVNNVPPTVDAITAPVNPQPVGTPINVSVAFADPGTDDTHTATWDWEDVISAGIVNETNGAGTVSGSYTYVAAGIYTIKVIVTDDDGGADESVFLYVVVYDPTGGFVTGGGWIDSPAGAYPAAPTLTGKATFGFVAKYKKGATAPTGQTEFQFQVADLNFHSGSYEWLVVAGANAKFKGVGTINGAGNYGFMLTATDGQLNGDGGVDKFRIKIWDKNNRDAIVYDNQKGQSDDSNAGTTLGGGSIVIKDNKGVTSANVSAVASAVESQTQIFLPLIKR